MSERELARIAGGGLLLTATLGLLSGASSSATDGTGYVLGAIPASRAGDVLHLLVGAWGVTSGRHERAARTFLRRGGLAFLGLGIGAFAAYMLLTSLDLVVAETGVLAMRGADVWMNLIFGSVLLTLGFAGAHGAHAGRAGSAAPIETLESELTIGPRLRNV